MSKSDVAWLISMTVAFVLGMLVIEILLAIPGTRVTMYAIIAAATLLPALSSSRPKRIWSVLATLLVLARLIWDHQDGSKYLRIRDAASQQVPNEQP
jgi:hypothetical protein